MNLPLLNEGAIQAVPGGSWIVQALKTIVNAVGAVWDVQHNPDGTHGTVTASKSITAADRYYEGARTAGMGYWSDVQPVFSAAGYTGGAAMTWTVASTDVLGYRWTVIGKTLIVRFHIGAGSTVGGVLSNVLHLPLPNGVTARDPGEANDYVQESWCRVIDNGVSVQGRCVVETAVSTLSVSRFDAANFAGPTVGIRGWIAVEVQ